MTIEEKQAYAEGLSFRAIATFLSRDGVICHCHMEGADEAFFDFPSNSVLVLTHQEVKAVRAEITHEIQQAYLKQYRMDNLSLTRFHWYGSVWYVQR